MDQFEHAHGDEVGASERAVDEGTEPDSSGVGQPIDIDKYVGGPVADPFDEARKAAQ
jgi:hypothetical protein